MHAIEDRLSQTFGAWAKGGLSGSRFAPARVLRPERRAGIGCVLLCDRNNALRALPWDSKLFFPQCVIGDR